MLRKNIIGTICQHVSGKEEVVLDEMPGFLHCCIVALLHCAENEADEVWMERCHTE